MELSSFEMLLDTAVYINAKIPSCIRKCINLTDFKKSISSDETFENSILRLVLRLTIKVSFTAFHGE